MGQIGEPQREVILVPAEEPNFDDAPVIVPDCPPAVVPEPVPA